MKYYTMFCYYGSGFKMAAGAPGLFWSNYYDDSDGKFRILNAEISEDESFSGTMTMTVPVTHRHYDYVVLGTIVEVCEAKTKPTLIEGTFRETSGDCIWIGRIVRISIDEWGNKTCTLEGPFTFLKDYIIQQGRFLTGGYDFTIRQVIENIVGSATVTSQLYDSFGDTEYSQFGGEALMVNCAVDSYILPSWMSNYYVSSSVFSDLFAADPNSFSSNQWCYIGETASAYDVIKNILDAWYDKRPDLSLTQSNLSYALSYTISTTTDNDSLKPKGRIINIRITEVSDTAWQQVVEYKDNILSLTNCIKSFNLTTSFDDLFTCAAIEGEEVSTSTSSSNFKQRYIPSLGLPRHSGEAASQTYNGIVNGYPEYIRKHGIHTGIINLKDLLNIEANDTQSVNTWVEAVMRRINAEKYECDIVAADVSEIDYWAAPITIGMYYRIITPATQALDLVYFRCTSRTINLMDSSKNEYKFSNYVRKDIITTTNTSAMSKRVKQLEKENKELRQISSELTDINLKLKKIADRTGVTLDEVREEEN